MENTNLFLGSAPENPTRIVQLWGARLHERPDEPVADRARDLRGPEQRRVIT
jgi:hypothetical protein